jgi:hypothetical protein
VSTSVCVLLMTIRGIREELMENSYNLQAASISCRAMFQKVALRAFEKNSRLADVNKDRDVGVGNVMRFWAVTKSDFAPFRCFTHSGTDASRSS